MQVALWLKGVSLAGWNSKMRDDDLSVPMIRLMIEPDVLSTGVIHYRSLEMIFQPVELHVDLDNIMSLVAYVGRLMPSPSAASTFPALDRPLRGREDPSLAQRRRHQTVLSKIDENSRAAVRLLLQSKLRVPPQVPRRGSSTLVYVELFHVASLVLSVEFLLGQQPKHRGSGGGLDLDPAALDEAVASGLETLGSSFVHFFASIARSFAQLSPTFVFNELLLTHYFGSPSELSRMMYMSMRQQAVTQSYKVLGSMDILGNPISLLHKMGNGVLEVRRGASWGKSEEAAQVDRLNVGRGRRSLSCHAEGA